MAKWEYEKKAGVWVAVESTVASALETGRTRGQKQVQRGGVIHHLVQMKRIDGSTSQRLRRTGGDAKKGVKRKRSDDDDDEESDADMGDSDDDDDDDDSDDDTAPPPAKKMKSSQKQDKKVCIRHHPSPPITSSPAFLSLSLSTEKK